MDYYLQFSLNLVSQLLPLIISIKRFSILDKASRFFCFVAMVGCAGELLGLYSAKVFRSNMEVYNVVGLINLVLLCLYFNYAVLVFKRYAVGFILSGVSIAVWIIAMFAYGGFHHISRPYMFFEGAITIAMSLIAIEQLIVRKNTEQFKLRYCPHFWFPWILFCYWCMTLIQWLLYEHYTGIVEDHHWINVLLSSVTIIVNICFFIVFYFYPKMNKQNVC